VTQEVALKWLALHPWKTKLSEMRKWIVNLRQIYYRPYWGWKIRGRGAWSLPRTKFALLTRTPYGKARKISEELPSSKKIKFRIMFNVRQARKSLYGHVRWILEFKANRDFGFYK
jgi:hypothetical protein